MQRALGRTLALAVAFLAFSACNDDTGVSTVTPPPVPTVISATGDITAKVVEYRTLLGDPSNGGTAGEQPVGRREISWDGAGANPFNNRNDFPAAFFNTNVKSGAVFTTPGTGFRNDSLRFSEVNATYAAEFSEFSPTKVFSPIGSNVMDVDFQIAGQPTPALVTGFGAAVRSAAAGLSFVGAKFAEAIVARVRITLGTGVLGAATNDISAGGPVDLVVADNFIYGEPRHVQ